MKVFGLTVCVQFIVTLSSNTALLCGYGLTYSEVMQVSKS